MEKARRSWVILELVPQPIQRHAKDLACARIVVTPHVLEQSPGRDDRARAVHQIEQQTKLGGGEVERAPFLLCHVPRDVQSERTRAKDHAIGILAAGPASAT